MWGKTVLSSLGQEEPAISVAMQQALRGDLRAPRVRDTRDVPCGSQETAREMRSSPRGKNEGTTCPRRHDGERSQGVVMVSADQGRQCHSRPPKHFILKSSKEIAEQERK